MDDRERAIRAADAAHTHSAELSCDVAYLIEVADYLRSQRDRFKVMLETTIPEARRNAMTILKLTDRRDRYRAALERISISDGATGEDLAEYARAALSPQDEE